MIAIRNFTDAVTPNSERASALSTTIWVSWAVVLLTLWALFKPTVFPGPVEVLQAYPGLLSDGLIGELWSSLQVTIESLLISSFVGLPLAYLSRVPLFSPIAKFVGSLRFLSSAVFYLPLLFVLASASGVKLWMLVLAELFSVVTSLTSVVQNIPESAFDDARTLRMSEWQTVWYVVVRGSVADTISLIRDNAATGWAMIMFVEGVVRSEGGVGVMILNSQKHANFADVWAITIVIFLVGIGQDWVFGQIRKVMCPYAA